MVKSTKKSTVNAAGNYTKPSMRKRLVSSIKAGGKGGKPGQWSARKAQMVAKQYQLEIKYIAIDEDFSVDMEDLKRKISIKFSTYY